MYPHNFHQSHELEKTYQDKADEFYLKYLNSTQIKRYNQDTEEDLKYQRKDIDVSVLKDDTWVHFSEKFRTIDYGDIYLELYSKFHETKGWMDTSEADFLVYFVPERVIIINEKSLRNFYQTYLIPHIEYQWIESFYENNKEKNAKQHLEIDISGRKLKTTLIQAFNKTKEAKWHTIGLSLKLSVFDKYGVKWKEYSLK